VELVPVAVFGEFTDAMNCDLIHIINYHSKTNAFVTDIVCVGIV
jgi:hypothetical protein